MPRSILYGLSIPLLCWLGSSSPALAQASISIKCGGDTYTVSTGNSKGSCKTSKVGDTKYAECTDSSGNSAGAACDVGCDYSKGSGGCKASSSTTPPPKAKGSAVKAVSVGGAKATDPPPKGKQLLSGTSTLGGTKSNLTNQGSAVSGTGLKTKQDLGTTR